MLNAMKNYHYNKQKKKHCNIRVYVI